MPRNKILEFEIENIELDIELKENELKRIDLRIKQIQHDLESQIFRQEETKVRMVDKIEECKQSLSDKRKLLTGEQ